MSGSELLQISEERFPEIAAARRASENQGVIVAFVGAMTSSQSARRSRLSL